MRDRRRPGAGAEDSRGSGRLSGEGVRCRPRPTTSRFASGAAEALDRRSARAARESESVCSTTEMRPIPIATSSVTIGFSDVSVDHEDDAVVQGRARRASGGVRALRERSPSPSPSCRRPCAAPRAGSPASASASRAASRSSPPRAVPEDVDLAADLRDAVLPHERRVDPRRSGRASTRPARCCTAAPALLRGDGFHPAAEVRAARAIDLAELHVGRGVPLLRVLRVARRGPARGEEGRERDEGGCRDAHASTIARRRGAYAGAGSAGSYAEVRPQPPLGLGDAGCPCARRSPRPGRGRRGRPRSSAPPGCAR